MKKLAYEFITVGNKIGGRQGWAYICNSGEYAVLDVDLAKEQEYDTFKKYGIVRLAWDYHGKELYKTTTLAHNICDDDDRWELASWGCCLSNSFGYHDAMELIRDSQAPKVRKGDIVALAEHTDKTVFLSMYKVGHIDIHCSTTAILEPLGDEEMDEVYNNGIKWLRR